MSLSAFVVLRRIPSLRSSTHARKIRLICDTNLSRLGERMSADKDEWNTDYSDSLLPSGEPYSLHDRFV